MISVDNISVSFNGNFLFKNVAFQLKGNDKVGLVGKNGAGKSTMLKILSKEQEVDTGNIVIPNDYSIGYLTQELGEQGDHSVYEEAEMAFSDISKAQEEIDQLTEELTKRTDYESDDYQKIIEKITELSTRLEFSGGGNYAGDIEKILIGLGFKREEFSKNIRTFSGGWRMRVELAKILLRKPSALFLDEPTNHLDIESIQWLEKYLENYAGTIVLISHDQEFLDNITNRTIEISSGRIYDFKCNYSKYLVQREVLFEQQLAAKVNQDKKIEDMEKFINRFRAQATKASAVQSKIKQLEKIERIELDERKVDQMKIRFVDPPRPGKVVTTVKGVSKSYGQKEVLKNIDLLIAREDKIAFVGKNGEGKSTLSKIIVNEVKADGDISLGHNVQIGYYAQNQAEELDLSKTVFETIDDIARGEIRKKIRDLLGSFLFSGEDIEKKVSVLSGGEKARLALCKLLLEPYNFLVLDEPTNHLDIPSKEILKEALTSYGGAIVVVSHDREFLRGLATKVYEFKATKIKEFAGDIDFFLSQKKIEKLDDLNTPTEHSNSKKAESKAKNDFQQKKSLESEQRKLNKQLANVEKKVASLESQKEELDFEVSKPENSNNMELFGKYEQLQKDLSGLMEEWEVLAEKIEHIQAQLNV